MLAGCTSTDTATLPAPTDTPASQARFATAADLGAAIREAALAAGTAAGTIEADSPDGSVRGEALYDFGDDGETLQVEAEVSVSAPIESTVLVVLDGVRPGDLAYIRLPAPFSLFSPTPWISVPLGAGTDLSTLVDDLAAALADGVPGDWLLGLDPAPQLTPLGQRTLDGVTVERFRVSGPVEAATGPREVTRTYWIDEDDRLLRVDTEVSGASTASTQTYRDWGRAVSVTVPDPDEVSPASAGLL